MKTKLDVLGLVDDLNFIAPAFQRALNKMGSICIAAKKYWLEEYGPNGYECFVQLCYDNGHTRGNTMIYHSWDDLYEWLDKNVKYQLSYIKNAGLDLV